ncbi:MAG: ATP-grasp domain-containing protein [Oscillospiraceae bacterium]|nr:ATP-grasp domain-containing protein [Oscillospiraceae bacterium]
MKQKLLVIGAGIGQIPIIEKAKKRGLYVICVTIPGDWPAAALADEMWYLDIYDREAIVERAKREGITAVISDQNDLMVPTVAYVAERLGLPGNRFEQVWTFCNKNRFRAFCETCGVPVPKHTAIDDPDFDFALFDAPLPWIVKPADSQSSKGVQKIDSIEQARPALIAALAQSKTKTAILEQFFTGKEVPVEGYVADGEYYPLMIGDRLDFELNGLMIPAQGKYPSVAPQEIQEKIYDYERKLAHALGASFAITHSEYLYNEQGEICIVESALRGGGVYISSHQIPLATGIDVNDLLLRQALGEPVDVKAEMAKRKDAAVAYVCFCLREGVIVKVEGMDKLKAMPFVKGVYLGGVKVGEISRRVTEKGMRYGPILVAGKDREDLQKHIDDIEQTLHVFIEKDGAMQEGIIWQ